MAPKSNSNKKKDEGFEILSKRGYGPMKGLNSGGQGNVYSTVKNQKLYAIKVVHITEQYKTLDEDLKRELEIIKSVKHPNCINVDDIFRTQHKVYICMDLMPNGSISDEVEKKKEGICEWKSKIYFSQIASAIRYLHKNGVAHRDLKLDNVLLDQNFNAKVCDFGFSKFVRKDPKTGKVAKCHSFVGTPTYEPPEYAYSQSYDPFKVDIWCLGVTLFVMLNYEYPFNCDESKEKLYQKQMKRMYKFEPKIDKKLSPAVKDLVKKLFEPKPEQRIDIVQVCKHHWIPNTFHNVDF